MSWAKFYIKDALAQIARETKNVSFNLEAGRVATAALILKELSESIAEQAEDIMNELISALPEKEKAARRAAFEYYKTNCGMGDWDSSLENDPYFLQSDAASIADSLEELFGDDGPTDIINDLRAC